MSKFSALDDLLKAYHQLHYHQNPQLLQRLRDVQAWQKNRIQATHAAQFQQKNNQLMAEYFINRLYGGPDFDVLAQQVERLLKYAHKVEKMLPASAIQTGTSAVSLAVLAVQLDEQVAMQLLQDHTADLPLNDEMMRLAYLKIDQQPQRLQQLHLLDQLGASLDKYMRSFVVYTAFKMGKSSAYKHQFETLYNFMHDGFLAMKPLKSAEQFINTFTALERQVIAKVHAGDPHPFRT